MKRKINRYRVHLIAGLILLPFLFLSAFTGFFRANHKWFWKEDYKKFKNFSYEYKIKSPEISLDSVFYILKDKYRGDITITDIKLKSEIGKLLYDIKIKGQEAVLIDASEGKILNPISPQLAKAFASQYVKPGLEFKNVYLDENYRSRKDKKHRPVYVVEYSDKLHTKIYIDKNNGEIEEEVDDNLKFVFWMVKLHDYDFWESKRLFLSFVGAGVIFLGFTGFYLWLRKKKKKIFPKSNIC
ncbi:MAG TPA: PepSY-associated TM helix domain-containing protein [Bacteroidia bacterium]|nr:PepSY-associated TM helix domain-containing protein [Bacteroidia bacterium]